MTSRLAKLLLIGGAALSLGVVADLAPAQAAEVGVGVNLELAPNEPPPLRVEPVPPPPYAEAFWVRGHWHWVGARWAWRAGYWARPPYAHASWVAPRYYGGRYFGGYWHR